MRIVLVSTARIERQALEELLEQDGNQVELAATVDEAIDKVLGWDAEVVIADVRLGAEGRALIRALAQRGSHPRVFLLCPRADCRGDGEPVELFTKPIDLERLYGRLHDLARVA